MELKDLIKFHVESKYKIQVVESTYRSMILSIYKHRLLLKHKTNSDYMVDLGFINIAENNDVYIRNDNLTITKLNCAQSQFFDDLDKYIQTLIAHNDWAQTALKNE